MSYGEEELELNDSADHDFLIFKVDLIDTIVLWLERLQMNDINITKVHHSASRRICN